MKPKRGILFRTGKELRDRVNRIEGALPVDDEDKDDDDSGASTPPVAAGGAV